MSASTFIRPLRRTNASRTIFFQFPTKERWGGVVSAVEFKPWYGRRHGATGSAECAAHECHLARCDDTGVADGRGVGVTIPVSKRAPAAFPSPDRAGEAPRV